MSTVSSIRRWALLSLPVAFALAAGVVAGRWYLSEPGGSDAKAATVLDQPRPLPAFTLVDGDGKVFDRDRLRDGWHLLFFGFTNCPDVCPNTLGLLSGVASSMPKRTDFQVVFVSVDPQRDDPAAVGEYARHFSSGFAGVTGGLSEIRKITDALHLPFSYVGDRGDGDYTVDHSAALVLIDPEARALAYFTPPHRPDRLTESLRSLIGSRG